MASTSPVFVAAVGGLVVFGTTASLLAKIVYELRGPGLDGAVKHFRKPWAMTAVMFAGMAFCLPVAMVQERRAAERRRRAAAERPASAPLLGVPEPGEDGGASSSHHHTLRGEARRAALLAVPTAFDLVATVLMNVGLLSVTASVYQMMRGAEMLFAAFFAVTFLGRTLNRHHAAGIACCVAGIAAVGAASVLSGEGSRTRVVPPAEMLAGMGLIIASQAVQAAQLTFEDHFMSDASLAMSPLLIVGWEGVLGAAAMAGVLLPLVSALPGKDGDGVHENTRDTLHMIRHSPTIATVLAVDGAALMLYNVAGMRVTGAAGAVFRTVLETSRTLFVWLVDLGLFYGRVGGGDLGESWTMWSWVQLAGFAVMVAGTLVYGKGDDVEAGRALAAALEAGDGVAVVPPAHDPATAAAPARAASGAVAAPAPARRPPATAPLGTPLSFRATMNIHTFSSSYKPASLAGSSYLDGDAAGVSPPATGRGGDV